MLMFAKALLESFVYDLMETIFFPNKKTKEIFNKYMIKRILPLSVSTDTGSFCVFVIFICRPESWT